MGSRATESRDLIDARRRKSSVVWVFSSNSTFLRKHTYRAKKPRFFCRHNLVSSLFNSRALGCEFNCETNDPITRFGFVVMKPAISPLISQSLKKSPFCFAFPLVFRIDKDDFPHLSRPFSLCGAFPCCTELIR